MEATLDTAFDPTIMVVTVCAGMVPAAQSGNTITKVTTSRSCLYTVGIVVAVSHINLHDPGHRLGPPRVGVTPDLCRPQLSSAPLVCERTTAGPAL